MSNFVRDMLLIQGSEAGKLYQELSGIAALFIGPMFIGSLCIQFLGGYDFSKVIVKLLVVSIVMTSFYSLHTKSVELSFEVANKTFKKVSPRNVFRKKWYRATLTKKRKVESGSTWGFLKEFVTPALNDLIASSFFVSSSIFISLLKYIYTSVYHLTYIFAGFSALLYFWGITEGVLWGMIKSSLWCILLPFVFISILSLIGNSLEIKAASGINMFSEIETIIWLFCVSLMLLMCPLITWKLVNSEGIAASAPQMGAISILAGSRALNNAPMFQSIYRQGRRKAISAKDSVSRLIGGRDKETAHKGADSLGFQERSSQKMKVGGERSSLNSNQAKEMIRDSQVRVDSRAVPILNGSKSKSGVSRNQEVRITRGRSVQPTFQKADMQRVEKTGTMGRKTQSLRTGNPSTDRRIVKRRGRK